MTFVLPALRRVRLAPAVLVLCTALATFAHAQPWQAGTDGLAPIPPLTARVTDLTQTLSAAERQALEAKLADWESRTANQFVVLMVPSTQPEPIEAYSIRVAEAWKIGRKGQDNGVLFTIAKNDKKLRLEVGYGLEGVLTDLTSRRIIAEQVVPHLRDGRFADGINAGVDKVIEVVGEGKPLSEAPAKKASRSGGIDFGTLLILLLIVVPLVGRIMRAILGKLVGSTVGAGVIGAAAWFVAGSLVIGIIAAIVAFLVMIFAGTGALAGRRGGVWMPGGGGSWGGGGGFGGGGGGFSGGGGSFGGGGASGSWN